jgi:serine/threonine protein kinase
LQHPDEWDPELVDFVSESLVKDLEQRPFARELIEHPLIKRGAICSSQVSIKNDDFVKFAQKR